MGTDNLFQRRKAKKSKDFKRKSDLKEAYEKILIVCEGRKTECNYFNILKDSLKLSPLRVQVDPNSNSSPKSVVKYALQTMRKNKDDPYDKIFCVFDRDKHQDFKAAIQLIETNHKARSITKIFGIISDPCFEFWLLLHFEYTTKQFGNSGRSACGDLISTTLRNYWPEYSKSNISLLQDLVGKKLYRNAIRNAKSIYNNAKQSNKVSPQTNVFVLVECLENLKNNQCIINQPIPKFYLA